MPDKAKLSAVLGWDVANPPPTRIAALDGGLEVVEFSDLVDHRPWGKIPCGRSNVQADYDLRRRIDRQSQTLARERR